MVTLLDLTFQPTNVTIMCWLNDVRPIDFWANDKAPSQELILAINVGLKLLTILSRISQRALKHWEIMLLASMKQYEAAWTSLS
jgi:hypothetical protein